MGLFDVFRSRVLPDDRSTLWIVTVTEECGLLCDLTDADTLGRVFRAAGNWVDRAHDHWVGPVPRITRRGAIGGHHSTTVAWLWEMGPRPTEARPDATTAGDIEQLRARVAQGVASIRNPSLTRRDSVWGAVTLTPYAPAIHGSVAWWSSGQAAQTRTRDQTPEFSLMADENPVGPTTADTSPTRLFDGEGGGSPVLLVPVILGAMGLVGAIVLAPTINSLAQALLRPRAPEPRAPEPRAPEPSWPGEGLPQGYGGQGAPRYAAAPRPAPSPRPPYGDAPPPSYPPEPMPTGPWQEGPGLPPER